jgi:hypothetical protein
VAPEDLKTARSRTVKAKPIRDDLRELEELRDVMAPELINAPIQRAIEAIESIRSDNSALYGRLKLLFSNRQLRDSLSAIQDAEEAIFAGTHPVELTTERLTKRTDLPLGWIEQKSRLGFD